MPAPAGLLLLALDDESGRTLVDSTPLDSGLTSAALIELVTSGSLVERDGTLHRAEPSSDELLDEIATIADEHSPQDAVMKVAGVPGWTNEAKVMRTALLERLVEDGDLTEHHSTVLDLVPRTTHPQADGSAEAALRAEIDAVLLHDRPCGERRAGLIGVAHACGVVAKSYADADAIERAERIASNDPNARAATDSYNTLMAGIIAMIVASTILH